MNDEYRALQALIPAAPDWQIDWAAIEQTILAPLIRDMCGTKQEKKWHAEGDVWRHTQMVCEALTGMPEFRTQSRNRQEILFVSALLHDIGKIRTTKVIDGEIRSPKHGSAGASMARMLMWLDFDLCGTQDELLFRETICSLIRYHMVPPRLLESKDTEYRLISIAVQGELLPDFTMEMLCILARADVLGRIADDTAEEAARVELFAEYAKENGCFDSIPEFASRYTKRAYFRGSRVWRKQELFDDTWGEVVVICGLPGTGKDTFIAQRFGDMPAVSLDDLRMEMGILPEDDQGRVAQAAKERMRIYLRAKKPFVFNATNLTTLTRNPLVQLSEQYGARVRILYLETKWEELLRRNAEREKTVPERVIASMLERLVPPDATEARSVEWICV